MRYTYRGDRHTDPALKGAGFTAVLRPDGNCIVAGFRQPVTYPVVTSAGVTISRVNLTPQRAGSMGTMLVMDEQGGKEVVLRQQLRKT